MASKLTYSWSTYIITEVIIFEAVSNQLHVIKDLMLTVVVGVGAADRGEGLSSFAWRRVFSFFIFARAFICNVCQVKGTFSREIICASPF